MSYKISKELLSEVLGINIDENDIYITNNYIYYAYCRSDNEWINPSLTIYELVHKCKEWLLGRGYDNWSGYHENEYFCFIITKGAFISTSEQQAVFDACQWVLDNKEK